MSNRNLVDASLVVTQALPNGAATVNATALDLNNVPPADHLAGVDIEIAAPAVTTGQLPDAQTLIYKVQTDDDVAFGSPTELYPSFLPQTGAGGAGAVAATKRFALPSNAERYVRVVCTKSGAGDASAASYTVTPKF